MGETQCTLFPLEFNRSARVRPAPPEHLTAETGALVLREVGERWGLWRLLAQALVDPRDPELITHPWEELLRTTVLLMAQGWPAQRHVRWLHRDPAFRLAVSCRKSDRALRPPRVPREPDGLCSQATLSRLFGQALASEENRAQLVRVLCGWAAHRVGLSRQHPRACLTLDLDSLPAEVHGHQPGSAYNGHYRCRCFHPLLLSWEFGDYLGALLREGNVYTSTDALAFVLPYLRWATGYARQVWLRADAGFPAEPFLAGLEAEDAVRYVMRLKSNAVLERLAAPHVDRILEKRVPEDRAHTIELRYAAKSWSRQRRVVLVIEERPDELMPHWFFLLTGATPEEAPGPELLAHYRQRGATEKDYGDWTNALDLSLSSTNRPKATYGGTEPRRRSPPVDSFATNEAILLMHLVAANLMHAGRRLSERARRHLWSRETFRRLVLKTSARIARSSRYVTFWIDHHRAHYWEQIAHELSRLHPIRGSPALPALPTPA